MGRAGRGGIARICPAAAAVALAGALVLAGCGNGGNGDDPDEQAQPAITATIHEPADATNDVITATEIVFSTENAADAVVELADLDGNSIDGELSQDGRWLPAGQLKYETTYVATLTATGTDGDTAVTTSTFTTMPEPEETLRVSSFIGDDEVVGVAMPLRIEFMDDANNLQEIPEEQRAEVERRMHVRTDPPQEGSWHWVSGAVVHYRPQEFWQPDTQINYRIATGGLPIGNGLYLRNDLNVVASVGPEILMEVDDDTKQMTVSVDGEVERTIPVSLGESRWRSSSGTFPIMEKFRERVFDTREEMGEDGYVRDVEYAMQLTYSGEFIHAAPWSVDDQGVRNVSHGCLNMSTENAEWLFDLAHRWGDPVVVENTGSQANRNDGWTDWNLDWEEYRQGSALYEG